MNVPRGITISARCFLLVAILTGAGAAWSLVRFCTHLRIGAMVATVVFALLTVTFTFVSRGLKKLSPQYRIIALCLAALNSVYLVCAIATSRDLRSDMASFGGAEAIGCVFAIAAFFYWFGSPLYYLTRSDAISAFTNRTRA